MKYSFFALLILTAFTSCRAQEKPLPSAKNNNTLLWEISGNGLKQPSYLFGTMHLLCKEDAVLSGNLHKAMEQCDTLYMELNMENMAEMLGAMMGMNMKGGVKLRDLLTEDEYKRVKDYFSKHGQLPFSMVENYKPMLLASTIMEEQLPCEEMGGMEMKMMQVNRKTYKKPLQGLETMAYQTGMFDSIPYEKQAKELLRYIDSAGKTGNDTKVLLEAYRSQNLQQIESLTLKGEPGLNEYMDLLLYQRNRNWVQKIKPLLAKNKMLIAVGAAHLVGKEGMIELLKKEGYKLRPIENKLPAAKSKVEEKVADTSGANKSPHS
jgi:uncharacterized protein